MKTALADMMLEALRQSAIDAGDLPPDTPSDSRNPSTVDQIMERQVPGWRQMSLSERDAYWHKHYGWRDHVVFGRWDEDYRDA